jgi:TolB protein
LQQPVCSPDSKKIALTLVQDGGANHEIFAIDADGSNAANLTNHPSFDADASWSPDGKRILFTSNRNGAFRLFVMDADGANVRQISEVDLAGWVYPSWSPDGAQVLFGGTQPDQTRQVFVANADGQGIEPLTDGPGVNAYPAWSPDGRYIAYLHFDNRPDQSPGGGRLKILDLDTGEHTEIAPDDMRCAAAPIAWRPVSK